MLVISSPDEFPEPMNEPILSPTGQPGESSVATLSRSSIASTSREGARTVPDQAHAHLLIYATLSLYAESYGIEAVTEARYPEAFERV